MYGTTSDQKYAHYLAWFEENVKDPSNWGWMRSDRDCSNWRDADAKPEPYSRGEALLMMSDPKAMRKALSSKIEANHQKYTEMGKYINGDPKQGTVNPEFQARFEQGKKLNAALAQMSPKEAQEAMDQLRDSQSQEGANYDDELFFAAVHALSAEKEVAPIDQPEEAPKSLASDFIHLLWKHGFPVEKFLPKKKLSVDVADKIGNGDENENR